MTTAPSVDILVRVLRLLKVMATVRPANAPRTECGISPVADLTAVLWLEAFFTSWESSCGVRSAIESKCRGANGDVCGWAADEYARGKVRCTLRKAATAGRRGTILRDGDEVR